MTFRTKTAGVAGWSLAVCLALLVGCDSSPTEPQETFLLDGVVEYEGRSDSVFAVTSPGVAKVEILDLKPLLVQVPDNAPDDGAAFPVFIPVVGLGFGVIDVAGVCQPVATFSVVEGDLYFFSILAGVQCVQIFDQGFFPVDAQVGYTVRVEVTR